jgi:hypothetical protein
MTKITRIIFISVVFIFIFALFSVEIRDSDFWWHLKTGEYIYHTGSLPASDPFAYTSLTKDPVNPESKRIKFILRQYWLAQLAFYWIYLFFDFQGIIYLRAFILTFLVFLLYKGIRREGVGPYLSIVLLIPAVIMLSSNFTGERPQLFSFLFAFLIIYCLEGFRKNVYILDNQTQVTGKLPLYYLLPMPFVMLLWSNMHGGFMVGIMIILGYLIAEILKYFTKRFGQILPFGSLKSLTIMSMLSIFLSFINPNGYNVISILLELENSRYKETIIEAMSPFKIGLYYPSVTIFFVILAISFIILMVNFRKLEFTDMVIYSGLTVMSLSAVRFTAFFTPFAIIMIARYGISNSKKLIFNERLHLVLKKSEIIFSVLLSILLIAAMIRLELFKDGVRLYKYPEGSVKFLKENRIEGNMFNPYYWGGYLLWALYPDYKVFIDGRGLIEQVYLQQLNVMQGKSQEFQGIPEWKAILDAYNIDFIITFSVDKFTGNLIPLIPAILNDPEWHLVYLDNVSLIFVRGSNQNRNIINRFEMPKEWLWNEVVTEAAIKSKDSPHRVNFLITIGDAFFAKKSYEEAKGTYLKAKKIEPDNRTLKERIEYLKAYGH